MANQGVFRFSNIVGQLDASVTITKGISPSVTSLLIEPSLLDNMSRVATAQWYFNGTLVREFPYSAVGDISTVDNGGLRLLRLRIYDRRWGWQFGQISGHYNIKRGLSVIPFQPRTPHQLAQLLFTAMGEANYDYSQLPNDDVPYTKWEVANPAKMLSELCESYQCEIVLMTDNSVKIVRKGEGGNLPGLLANTNTPRTSYDKIVNPEEYPGKITCVSAPVRWQVFLKLDPVGYEDGATIPKPIDELSYAPDGVSYVDEYGDTVEVPESWEDCVTDGSIDLDWITIHYDDLFAEDGAVLTNEQKKKVREKRLAEKHIFKTFRISIEDIKTDPAPELPLDVEWTPPEDIALKGALVPILFMNQLLPISSNLIQTEEVEGIQEPVPSEVWGRFWDGSVYGNTVELDQLATAMPKEWYNKRWRYKGSFSVDEDNGLVSFGEVMRLDHEEGDALTRPELFLWTTVQLNHPDTLAPQRHGKSIVIDPTSPAGDAFETRDDIQPGYLHLIRSPSPSTREFFWKDNIARVNDEMNFFLQQAMKKYLTYPAETATHAGILDIDLDGAIQQVSITIDGSGTCSTGLSRNCDIDLNILSSTDARRAQKMTEVLRLYGNGRNKDNVKESLWASYREKKQVGFS